MSCRIRLALVLALALACHAARPPARGDGDEPARQKSNQDDADSRFERLLDAAKKAPAKADWKAVRRAFARTSFYRPYHFGWQEEIGKVSKALERGQTKQAGELLAGLLDREHCMRIDAEFLAVALYEKTGERDKAALHRGILEGLSDTLFVPGHGTSFEKPIEVLFIDEEYMVLAALKLRKGKQALVNHGGHKFDVLTPQGQEQRPLYFNVDLLHEALNRSLKVPSR